MIDDILTSRYSNESLLLYVVHNISRSCIVAYVRANENTATHRWTPVTLRLNRVSWSVLNNRTHLRTYRPTQKRWARVRTRATDKRRCTHRRVRVAIAN